VILAVITIKTMRAKVTLVLARTRLVSLRVPDLHAELHFKSLDTSLTPTDSTPNEVAQRLTRIFSAGSGR
jgi:hypothetical protein